VAGVKAVRGEAHPGRARIKAQADVTVDERPDDAVRVPTGTMRSETTPTRRSGIMPHLEFGAVRATWRAAVRRLDVWTLQTLNSPAGGRHPRS
jgi:hypothetical protein